MLPLDLHVLGLPLAFILSQDQTLHRCLINKIPTQEPPAHEPLLFLMFLIVGPRKRADQAVDPIFQ